MSLFLPNVPQPGDDLQFSQPELLSNNQGLDTVFGVDHYKFSDATVNKGFHNQVTQPAYVASPPTGLPPATTTNPILYSFQQTAPMGVLQYSRGPSNAAPSPVTSLQSPIGGITLLASPGTISIMDFTGVPTIAIAELYFGTNNTTFPVRGRFSVLFIAPNTGLIIEGTSKDSGTIPLTFNALGVQFAGNILKLTNINAIPFTMWWTLRFLRVE